ncbi:polysaccharide deacetylase family protein, partial [uncultured Clostridium sp.]|uniref:polysaccharide deacetylase family protein n=1 Tax=uncultured Clostridium sp. TaxID=59620 RepID=UPI00261BC55B
MRKWKRNIVLSMTMVFIGMFLAGAYYLDNKTKSKEVSKNEIVKNDKAKKQEKGKKKVKKSNVIESAKKYAVPAKEVNAMLNGKKNGKKEVFLTFDDGPSKNTPEILKILKKYKVHGTFFVLGSNVENSSANKKYVKDAYKSGNAIANHTYSHNFKKIYPRNRVDVKAFMGEYHKTDKILKGVLGSNFETKVMRMPGGYMSRKYYKDKNLGALNKALNKEKIVSIDWNIDSTDTSAVRVPANKIVSNTIKAVRNSEDIVLLMHDAG